VTHYSLDSQDAVPDSIVGVYRMRKSSNSDLPAEPAQDD
jgi:hypothetical protein